MIKTPLRRGFLCLSRGVAGQAGWFAAATAGLHHTDAGFQGSHEYRSIARWFVSRVHIAPFPVCPGAVMWGPAALVASPSESFPPGLLVGFSIGCVPHDYRTGQIDSTLPGVTAVLQPAGWIYQQHRWDGRGDLRHPEPGPHAGPDCGDQVARAGEHDWGCLNWPVCSTCCPVGWWKQPIKLFRLMPKQ